MKTKKHTIKNPTNYNFLKVNIPEHLKDQIEIKPSTHNKNVPPEFFDFGFINIATIRDGFKGEYYLNLTVLDTFKDENRGKPIHLPIEIVEKHFNMLPGYKDPTKNYHDYKLQIPDIVIGVPYGDGKYKGKIFYSNSYSSDLQVNFELTNNWKIEGYRFIAQEDVIRLRQAAVDKKNGNKKLRELFDRLKLADVQAEVVKSELNTKYLLDLKKSVNEFPMINLDGNTPDNSTLNLLVKTTASN